MYKYIILFLLSFFGLSGTAFAQIEGEDIGDEIINGSLNGFIRSGDSISGGIIVSPRTNEDIDLIITAISKDVDPLFDPQLVVTVRDLDGTFEVRNDDWEILQGGQNSQFLEDQIDCYIANDKIPLPGTFDSVVVLSLDGPSIVEAEASSSDFKPNDEGKTVLSFQQVDGAEWNTHNCQDI